MKRYLGLAHLTALELTPAQLITTAATAGYDGVGLRLVPVVGQAFPHAPLDLPAIENAVKETGLRIYDIEVFRLEAQTKVAEFEPMLEISQRLGATELLVHGADVKRAITLACQDINIIGVRHGAVTWMARIPGP